MEYGPLTTFQFDMARLMEWGFTAMILRAKLKVYYSAFIDSFDNNAFNYRVYGWGGTF
jgi:hypothetical protein